MKLPSLWSSSQNLMSDPYRSIRREMEDMFRTFDRHLPSLRVGAGVLAINVAETKDAFEVTIEVPGVDEKDINVSLDGNQLVISGEKKEETKKDEKDWHVEERAATARSTVRCHYPSNRRKELLRRTWTRAFSTSTSRSRLKSRRASRL